MAHGGYRRQGVGHTQQGGPISRRSSSSRGLGPDKKKKKLKPISLKNQIRSVERVLLRKNLPVEVRNAQEKRLEELKHQFEIHNRPAIERKLSLRYRRVKFFERRKIERRIRRLEKWQKTTDRVAQEQMSEQLSQLREDLEYVKFFPKTEKYVSLFMGGDDTELKEKRNNIRKLIKANLLAAAASGKDIEETGSDEDGPLDVSEDDFFLSGSSSDEAEADDEWTDKSTRGQASSTSGKATSGMSSDEKNQKEISARALMPPPRPSANDVALIRKVELPSSSNNLQSRNAPSSSTGASWKSTTGTGSSLSSNSDAHKPKRKRRHRKKKKHQA